MSQFGTGGVRWAEEVARDEFSGGWVRAGSSWGLGLHSSHGSSHL